MSQDDHDKTVRLLIGQALEKLQDAADLLRGPLVPASHAAMRIEIAVSDAIDVLIPVRGGHLR